MKATELRMGNYVFPEEDEHADIGFSIDAGDILACKKKIHGYKPIPLTEEWLVKFGFESVRYSMSLPVYNLDGVIELQNDFSISYNGSHKVEIKWVHQLQNIIHALTGEELML